MIAALPRPGIPAVNVSGKEEQLQQQAGVQLDLKEDDGEQRDVDQTECIVDDLLGLASQIHSSPAMVPTASIRGDRTPAPMGICTKIFCVLKNPFYPLSVR